MLVADTNVLIELFLPSSVCEVVLACQDADGDWRLLGLWVPEFRHVLQKFLRAGRLDLPVALNHLDEAEQAFLPRTIAVDSATCLQLAHRHGCSSYGCSSYNAEYVVLAQLLQCPLLTFDRKLLELFPEVAVQPGS